jgi:hypothetical protein
MLAWGCDRPARSPAAASRIGSQLCRTWETSKRGCCCPGAAALACRESTTALLVRDTRSMAPEGSHTTLLGGALAGSDGSPCASTQIVALMFIVRTLHPAMWPCHSFVGEVNTGMRVYDASAITTWQSQTWHVQVVLVCRRNAQGPACADPWFDCQDQCLVVPGLQGPDICRGSMHRPE